MFSFEKIEVVPRLPVVLHRLSNCALLNPGDVIFHYARHVECRVCHRVNSDLYMALLDVLHCILYCFGHLKFLHDHGQSSPAESRHCSALLDCSKSLP
jgi:hypothetical protein